MIETVTSLALPADEVLRVQKNRILPMGKDCGKRICIVTGIHGDELEGQYVCYKVLERIERERDKLTGTVDIYPAMNPLGIDSVTRGIPGFDLDMNRIFPGNSDGTMAEYVASEIIKDLSGADLCIDIHASNIYLTEIPQVRINELHKDRLVPIAEKLNVDLIWVHGNATVLKSTLAYSLNSCGTDTLVVEMGVGMRITKEYCEQLTDGIFRVMKEMGMWQGSTGPVRRPMISEGDGDVLFLNAGNSGVFVQTASHGQFLEEGEEIGRIIDPLRGVIRERVLAPERGVLFTIREYPVVDEGSLVARILRREAPYEKVCDL
ncbi:MAG: M14 family metallopeptidase [Clostridia bacterium]|nr:M14 family metallopeptidase [Clostridia bacterium]